MKNVNGENKATERDRRKLKFVHCLRRLCECN